MGKVRQGWLPCITTWFKLYRAEYYAEYSTEFYSADVLYLVFKRRTMASFKMPANGQISWNEYTSHSASLVLP